MNHKAGLWIDHRKAVIVSGSAGPVTVTTVESNVGEHARYSSQAGYPTPNGPHEGGGEHAYEARFGHHLNRYFDQVIARLGQPESLLLFGPGEAKLQFRERLRHAKALANCAVIVETTDKMTDPQIIAKMKEHYGMAL